MSDNSSMIPKTHVVEKKTDFHKLSSDLYMRKEKYLLN